MNAQIRLLKILLVLLFSAAIIAPLASCAPAALGAVEMGVEPTATPTSLSYNNPEYGFSFDYPVTWSLSEGDHQVVLTKGTSRLVIRYRWFNENLPPARTGMAAGTPIYSGKLNFMGQTVPVEVVEYEHFRKYVLYGDSGQVEAGELTFFLILEDVESDYQQLNLAQSTIDEANAILNSFERKEATGSPPDQAASSNGGAPLQTTATAWLGHIASLPAGSQFDDMLVLYPKGTGEFGLMGATPDLETEIAGLRDSQGPNEYVHVWGELNCGVVADYNDCRLVVDRLQYGANFSEEPISDWIGTITTSTFNGGLSYVFQLDNYFPMQYSIHASQNESLQAQIQYYQASGEPVEVSGTLMVGVPDVNGSRIEVSTIEPMSMAGPRPDITDGVMYVNEEYGFSFEYSSGMTLVEEPNLVLLNDGDAQLRIGYRRADEPVNLAQTGDLAGEFHPYNEVFFLEQPVQPALNIQEGRIRGVYLGGAGVELGQGSPLRFVITMVNSQGGWLANGQVDRMLQVLNNFELQG